MTSLSCVELQMHRVVSSVIWSVSAVEGLALLASLMSTSSRVLLMSDVIKNVVASLYCQSGSLGTDATRRLTTAELMIGVAGFFKVGLTVVTVVTVGVLGVFCWPSSTTLLTAVVGGLVGIETAVVNGFSTVCEVMSFEGTFLT